MKLGFLIIAHSDPSHVARLAERLAPAAERIFVHVNRKSEIGSFETVLPSECRLVKNRVPVTWGTCSLWDAVVSTTREALEEGSCDRLVLLSQSCYPVVSAKSIGDFFDRHEHDEFLGAQPMLRQWIGRWRLKFNMLQSDLPRQMHAGLLGSIVRRLAIARPALDWRAALGGRQPFSGTLWWALTADAARFVMDEYQSNQVLRDYAQFVFGPEEIVPHTLLMNSAFASQVRHHLTFEDWSRRGPSPKWLDSEDVRRITAPGFRWQDRFGTGVPLFARKFGGDAGTAACNDIDQLILKTCVGSDLG